MKRTYWLAVVLTIPLALGTGCGTLLSGTRQTVRVTTTPRDATVSLYELNGEPLVVQKDNSAGTLDAPRPKRLVPYLAIISAEGHCPVYSVTTVNPTAPYMAEAMLLAIPFIQVIGFTLIQVDDRTGGCCAIEPIVAELEEGTCE